MRARKSLPALLGLVAGLGSMAMVALPAQAGDTGRYNGCAAHWRTTAAWNECQNAPAVRIRLEAECDWQVDYVGIWKNVSGWVDPIDRHECFYKTIGAWNGFA